MRFLFVAEWFRIIAEKNFNDKAIFAIDYSIFISVFFYGSQKLCSSWFI